ncbi:hypothetical protein GQ43DRAFT_437621 [Delitschia confertaspora ATCC 74209]|uniref:Zn(2)-C6 fungal-type domain-containing protein n=1 Tax=Delitschia confertaspora ATCC 74209 TaxID=1513339 RepID=A0A9P4JUP9_9PLEO|nr:hypothetical protein GQ43DRAFT_437621 [Delitschia confertaspora ATCC 74209]
MTRDTTLKDTDTQSASSYPPSERPKGKRRCVSSACVPCRRRKSKCDGGTPICATCTAVYKTECFYDAESESRRSKAGTGPTPQKRESTGVADTNENAGVLLKLMQSLPESDVSELVQHIRREKHLDVPALLESWKRVVTLPPKPLPGQDSLEGDLSVLLGKPAVTQTGVSRHYGHTSGLSLVAEDENYTRSQMPIPNRPRLDTWTIVTQDLSFIHYLFDLYFEWSHGYYTIFSRECFYQDFESGRQKYCSPLLVNAICAYGCHFTDDPRARTDKDNFRTAGDYFFAEAKRLLFEDETPSLTTVQGLAVMAMREPSAGRDSSGYAYMGRCMHMAVELGLHLDYSLSASSLGLTASEIEVRKITFWGIFIVENAWSVCIGRIAQLPRTAITCERPLVDEAVTGHGYHQCPSTSLLPDSSTPPVSRMSRMFFEAFATLSELINDNLFMFFAPRDRFTSRRLLDTYNKYQSWYRTLPQALHLPQNPEIPPQPHIITLHSYYHTIILHLFRPLLKMDIIHSDIRPRTICIESANRISELLRLYRRHYSLRSWHLVSMHILLSIGIVHLLFSPTSEISAQYLVETLEALEDASTGHWFGARSFKIIHGLSQQWGYPFPETILKNSKLIPKINAATNSPTAAPSNLFPTPTASASAMTSGDQPSQTSYFAIPANNPQAPRSSLSLYPNPSSDPHPHQQPPLAPSGRPTVSIPTSSSSSSSSLQHHPYNPAHNHMVNAPALAQQLFWTPIQGIGVPLLAKDSHMSPMDLNIMLDSVDNWERFTRDGFKVNENWALESGVGDGMGVSQSAEMAGIAGDNVGGTNVGHRHEMDGGSGMEGRYDSSGWWKNGGSSHGGLE